MKSFEPRSMMQEHPQYIIRTSARRKRLNSWTSQQTFLILNFTLVLLRRRLTKGIQSRAHLYYVIDRKTFNTIKAGR
jgi:hypothetical protein